MIHHVFLHSSLLVSVRDYRELVRLPAHQGNFPFLFGILLNSIVPTSLAIFFSSFALTLLFFRRILDLLVAKLIAVINNKFELLILLILLIFGTGFHPSPFPRGAFPCPLFKLIVGHFDMPIDLSSC